MARNPYNTAYSLPAEWKHELIKTEVRTLGDYIERINARVARLEAAERKREERARVRASNYKSYKTVE